MSTTCQSFRPFDEVPGPPNLQKVWAFFFVLKSEGRIGPDFEKPATLMSGLVYDQAFASPLYMIILYIYAYMPLVHDIYAHSINEFLYVSILCKKKEKNKKQAHLTRKSNGPFCFI